MPEVGERYLGTVVKTTNFGAFVSLLPGKDGLLHITKLRALAGGKRVENVEDVVSVGQKIQVEIAEIDDRGKLSLIPVVEDDAGRAADAATSADVAARPTCPVADGRRRQPTPAVTTRTLLREATAALVRRTVLPSGLRVVTEACRACGRRPSGSGSASAPATSRRAARLLALPRAPALQGHPAARRRSTSRSRSTRSAVSSTPSPPRSTPASTRGCSTTTCRWRSTSSATWSPRSLLDAADVDAERDVILDEIAMHDDDPDDVVHDLFAAGVFGDTPLGRPIAGHRRLDRGADPRADRRLLPAPLPAREHGRRGRRQRRPRHRRPAGPQGVRRAGFLGRRPADAGAPRAGGRRRRARRRRRRRAAAPTEQVNVVLGVPGDLAPDDAPLRARRAERRARRRHVAAGCSRRSARSAAWPTRSSPSPASTPTPACFGVSAGCPPAQARPGARARAAPSWRRSRATASPPRSSRAARASCGRPGARPGGLRLADDPDRQGRAGPRRAAQHRRGARPDRRASRSTTCATSPPTCWPLRRPSPWSARSTSRASSPRPWPEAGRSGGRARTVAPAEPVRLPVRVGVLGARGPDGRRGVPAPSRRPTTSSWSRRSTLGRRRSAAAGRRRRAGRRSTSPSPDAVMDNLRCCVAQRRARRRRHHRLRRRPARRAARAGSRTARRASASWSRPTSPSAPC